MAVDEHGIEAIRNAAEYVDPTVVKGNKDKYLKVGGLKDTDPNHPLPPIGVYRDERNRLSSVSVQSTTTPGTQQTLINYTVPANQTEVLRRIVVKCVRNAKWFVEINGNVEGSAHTGSADVNSKFEWMPGFTLNAGDVILVKALQATGSAAEIDAYYQAFKF